MLEEGRITPVMYLYFIIIFIFDNNKPYHAGYIYTRFGYVPNIYIDMPEIKKK